MNDRRRIILMKGREGILIEVKHLTKRYGAYTAVEDLSFTIPKGTIYGFLGPNGAGKSTTMNIITGCLGATAGEVLIGGHSILDEPMEAKKLIGYLPEQPPLYADMTVSEYLSFVAEARGIPMNKRQEQKMTAMEKTGITEAKGRLIKNLSKGYKQRVGIAQALIGDPDIIILDEPTVGLDPTQIIEIRSLIRDLGRDHTVILSSHILSEVQAVCDTILIIAKGKLVACDTPENLTRLLAGETVIKLEAECSAEELPGIFEMLEGVKEVRVEETSDGVLKALVVPESGVDVRKDMFFAFSEAGTPILEMHLERASLEDVFIELTREKENSPDKSKKRFFARRKEAEQA